MAEIAARYKARPRIAGIVSEEWCTREMYCPACDSNRLLPEPVNNPAIDFSCPVCRQLYQLKSSAKWNLNKVPDAAYDAMVAAIRADRTPHLLLMHYSLHWAVSDLVLIPRMFFTESVIEKRKPLSANASRVGWVGCNILLSGIPADGKIKIVSAGRVVPSEQVRREFSRIRVLGQIPPNMRGWTLDVLNLIRRLNKPQFALDELYAFESELSAAHPQNRNVRPKIRQQLQILRDLGILLFDRRGHYKLVEAPR